MGATALVLRFALPHLKPNGGAGLRRRGREPVVLLAVPEPLSGTPVGAHVALVIAALRKRGRP